MHPELMRATMRERTETFLRAAEADRLVRAARPPRPCRRADRLGFRWRWHGQLGLRGVVSPRPTC